MSQYSLTSSSITLMVSSMLHEHICHLQFILDDSSRMAQTCKPNLGFSCQSMSAADMLCSRSYLYHLRLCFFFRFTLARLMLSKYLWILLWDILDYICLPRESQGNRLQTCNLNKLNQSIPFHQRIMTSLVFQNYCSCQVSQKIRDSK